MLVALKRETGDPAFGSPCKLFSCLEYSRLSELTLVVLLVFVFLQTANRLEKVQYFTASYIYHINRESPSIQGFVGK